MKVCLMELGGLPREQFYVTLGGKLVDDWGSLTDDDNFHVHLRVLGGKGGFGSLLRSFGSQFYKSTNQDMCRDLSGRRLKDVKEEEKLKKYISKAAQRENEKQKKLEEKYKKLKHLEEKKHDFNDVEYSRQKERILEETDDAVQEGLKAARKDATVSPSAEEPGPSGIKSAVLGKRKHEESGSASSSASSSILKLPATQPEAKKSKKPLAGDLWLGIGELNDSDLEDSDDETGSDIAEVSTELVVKKITNVKSVEISK